jgi:hypothetical protein
MRRLGWICMYVNALFAGVKVVTVTVTFMSEGRVAFVSVCLEDLEWRGAATTSRFDVCSFLSSV